jgi:hypothetical protein
MPFEVGGSKCWRKFRRGNLLAALHWLDGEPAILLAAAGSRSAYAIPLPVIHQYARADGYPEPEALARLAPAVADHLGLGLDRSTLYQVVEIVLDALPDLVAMPPAPPADQKPEAGSAGLVIKQGGRIVFEREVPA